MSLFMKLRLSAEGQRSKQEDLLWEGGAWIFFGATQFYLKRERQAK